MYVNVYFSNFQTCCEIVPSDEFTPTPYLNISTTDIVEFEYYTSQKLLLVDNSEVNLIYFTFFYLLLITQ